MQSSAISIMHASTHRYSYSNCACNVHVGLYTDVQPIHSTILPMCLTVVLVTRYVAIPHQPAVEVRNEATIV